MAAEKSYAGLGLFLVVVMLVILGTALFFLHRMRERAVIAGVTYTTANVSGLDVSSPVRYRGVPIGRVTDLRVDPGANIEIGFEVFTDRLTSIGIDLGTLNLQRSFDRLRAQVVSNPVTGESYLLLDHFENAPPPIALKFKPDRLYVASIPTMLSEVQDRLPEILERASMTLATMREIIVRVPGSLDRSDKFFATVEQVLRESQIPELTADSRKFLENTNAHLEQVEKATSQLTRLVEIGENMNRLAEQTHATIQAADLPATAKAARETSDRSSLAADDLRRSLPVMRESLEELRQLSRFLAQQPESIVYGARTPAAKPNGAKSK